MALGADHYQAAQQALARADQYHAANMFDDRDYQLRRASVLAQLADVGAGVAALWNDMGPDAKTSWFAALRDNPTGDSAT